MKDYSRPTICGLLIVLTMSILVTSRVEAQIYGLAFSGAEVNKDRRTGLDLTPEKPFEFSKEFELSFDISLNPGKMDYFGYVFRIVADNQNFDLVHNITNPTRKDFSVVAGSRLTTINFDLSQEQLFERWRNFRIKFDPQQDAIHFFVNDTCYSQQHAGLKKQMDFRIMFGANNSAIFKTTDVPSMRIKDIRISLDEKKQFHWPLNETEGAEAIDLRDQKKALVSYPNWLTPLHFNWENIEKISLKGFAQVAFNPTNELIYLIGSDSLLIYSANKRSFEIIKYKNQEPQYAIGDMSFYDIFTQKLYNYSPDRKFSTSFDFALHKWDRVMETPNLESIFLHHNRIVLNSDTNLYLYGGYGHHKYLNTVQKLNFRKNLWEKVVVDNKSFRPRYLSAIGKSEKSDTIYIIGGYGSESGDQILNPQNYYDLVAYIPTAKSFHKIYDFNAKGEDFCFAGSMVINYENNQFYALTFPQNKYNCELQLIEGSLKKPGYKLAGTRIPYSFHDIRSFADLFYCPKSKKLLAVTIHCNENQASEISIYSVKFPPNTLTLAAPEHKKPVRLTYILIITGLVICLILAGTYFLVKRRKAKKTELLNDIDSQYLNVQESNFSQSDPNEKIAYKNSVILFGDFQVFNKDGIDISRKFSPLVKELFLLILFYTLKNSKGISPEKLDEILWFDKDEKSARNNRAVNIAKLKDLLAELENIQLINSNGYWHIGIEQGIVLDYHVVCNLLKTRANLGVEQVKVLLQIVKGGALLPNLHYEWLDEFKSQTSNNLIDELLKFSISLDHKSDPVFSIQIADAIFQLDSVNEDAMMLKCRSLVAYGKHGLAKQTFQRFCNEYKNLYNENYKTTFDSLF